MTMLHFDDNIWFNIYQYYGNEQHAGLEGSSKDEKMMIIKSNSTSTEGICASEKTPPIDTCFLSPNLGREIWTPLIPCRHRPTIFIPFWNRTDSELKPRFRSLSYIAIILGSGFMSSCLSFFAHTSISSLEFEHTWPPPARPYEEVIKANRSNSNCVLSHSVDFDRHSGEQSKCQVSTFTAAFLSSFDGIYRWLYRGVEWHPIR